MPADPQVGMTYQQEVAPGVAEDIATVVRRGSVSVPVGTFDDAVRFRDFNPLDGSKCFKWYAHDVGIVVDGPLSLIRYTA
jgi:hypothetical protein